jgi:putative colanic acid biosynthesis UDP-glucose lipid carrier transferase
MPDRAAGSSKIYFLTLFYVRRHRVENICLGAIFLFVFAPLMAFIALAVRLDSRGAILDKQKQRGPGGLEIELFRFRTALAAAPDERDGRVAQDGGCMTRVGWFLSKSSLNELPLLLNVVRGDMCLVGQRRKSVADKDKIASVAAE